MKKLLHKDTQSCRRDSQSLFQQKSAFKSMNALLKYIEKIIILSS